jgi:hypothetical protein
MLPGNYLSVEVLVGFEFEFDKNAKPYRVAIRQMRLDFMRKFYATSTEPLSAADVELMQVLFSDDNISWFTKNMLRQASFEMTTDPQHPNCTAYLRAVNLFTGSANLAKYIKQHFDKLPPIDYTAEYFASHILAGNLQAAYNASMATDATRRALEEAMVECLHDTCYDYRFVIGRYINHPADMTAAIRVLPFDDRRNIQRSHTNPDSYDFEMIQLEWFLQSQGLNMKGSSIHKYGAKRSYDSNPGAYIETDINEELVTDPVPLPEALMMMEKVCGIIYTYFKTSEDDGVHINISVPGRKANEYDPLKTWLASNETAILKQFKRDDNGYCTTLRQSMWSVVDSRVVKRTNITYDKLITSLKMPMSSIIKDMSQQFKIMPGFSKCNSINFAHTLKDVPYIEFRMCGNAGYESKVEALTNAVKTFANATVVGSDRALETEWYANEIASMVMMNSGIDLRTRKCNRNWLMRMYDTCVDSLKSAFSIGYSLVEH